MSTECFEASLAFVLKWEGSEFTNDPDDHGGATRFGVIQREYDAYRRRRGLPLQSVRFINMDEVREIYRREYWDEVEGDLTPAPLDVVSFDTSVLMGVSRAVRYGLGAKVPFHGATPGRQFTRVDCSGFIREAIWRSKTPHLNFPDGSVVQHDWVRARGFTRGTARDALLRDGAVRIVFLRPQDSRSGVGHVSLVHNAQTLESHGGVGPDSRAWTVEGWQARAFVYMLLPTTT